MYNTDKAAVSQSDKGLVAAGNGSSRHQQFWRTKVCVQWARCSILLPTATFVEWNTQVSILSHHLNFTSLEPDPAKPLPATRIRQYNNRYIHNSALRLPTPLKHLPFSIFRHQHTNNIANMTLAQTPAYEMTPALLAFSVILTIIGVLSWIAAPAFEGIFFLDIYEAEPKPESVQRSQAPTGTTDQLPDDTAAQSEHRKPETLSIQAPVSMMSTEPSESDTAQAQQLSDCKTNKKLLQEEYDILAVDANETRAKLGRNENAKKEVEARYAAREARIQAREAGTKKHWDESQLRVVGLEALRKQIRDLEKKDKDAQARARAAESSTDATNLELKLAKARISKLERTISQQDRAQNPECGIQHSIQQSSAT